MRPYPGGLASAELYRLAGIDLRDEPYIPRNHKKAQRDARRRDSASRRFVIETILELLYSFKQEGVEVRLVNRLRGDSKRIHGEQLVANGEDISKVLERV